MHKFITWINLLKLWCAFQKYIIGSLLPWSMNLRNYKWLECFTFAFQLYSVKDDYGPEKIMLESELVHLIHLKTSLHHYDENFPHYTIEWWPKWGFPREGSCDCPLRLHLRFSKIFSGNRKSHGKKHNRKENRPAGIDPLTRQNNNDHGSCKCTEWFGLRNRGVLHWGRPHIIEQLGFWQNQG